MKRLYLLCALSCLCYIAALADEDCDQAVYEAKIAYNAGNYAKAKSLFDYVVSECGANYGNAASWVQKCKDELTPKLTASRTYISVGATSGTTSINVTSNREWKLQNTTSDLFSVSKNGGSVTINYYTNSKSSSRSDYFDIVTLDGSKSVRITITQSAAAVTLTVSKTAVSCSASGTTEYLTVSCNKPWEIQYPSGGMYSAWRDGNKVIVKISANTTNVSRKSYFNIRTTDGKKSIKITLSQGAGTSSSSSSRSSSSSYQTNSSRSYGSSTYSSPSKYRQYINNCGVFEVTWYSMRLGIGTSINYSVSPLKLRWGPIQVSPLECSAGWDFLQDTLAATYQPTIDAVIPINGWSAIYAGMGPTIDLVNDGVWFKIEAGWHYHWGNSASSDFFLRYDGAFCIGASIQWSTGW